MSYSLHLRPKSLSPLSPESLHQQLLAAGLKQHPDHLNNGLLCDQFAQFEMMADPDVPAGISVLVKIPCQLEFFEVTLELLNLERLSNLLDADLVDGDEVLTHRGWDGLNAHFALFNRYERTSEDTSPLIG